MTSVRLFTATSLSLLGLQVGLRQVLQEVSVRAPVLFCPPALHSSGLMLDIQLSGDFAAGWHWCLPPPTFPQQPSPTQPRPPAPQRRQLSLPDTTTAMTCDPSALLRCTWSFSRPQTLVFTTNMPCRRPTSSVISILYHFPPLPRATSFYVDDTFCHFGKCKQTSMSSLFFFFSLVDIQYPSFLVIGRKKGREHTQAWASSVPHKEFSSTQYLKPLLPVLAWNREYLILSLYGTPRAGLAGSHVILICFYHSNSKLKQLAGRRQAVNQGRYTTSRFHKRIFLPSSHFLSYSLHLHTFHTQVRAKRALNALGTTRPVSERIWFA